MPVEPGGLDAAPTHTTDPAPQPPPSRSTRHRPRPGSAGLFRAFWRWHFYASLLVIPVVLVLAVTGLIYLFRFQLEPVLYGDLVNVEQPAGAIAQPYAAQLAKVEAAYPDAEVVSVTEPRDSDRSSVFSLSLPDGSTRDVYVDPYHNEVLGDMDPDTTVAGTAVRLHADLMSGRLGDYVIEIAACWAIVMALTGYYLFVKGRTARRRRVEAGADGARLRSRHGVVGAFVGLGLLMLLVSGLPWTGFWGAKAQQLATSAGSSLWSIDPGALSDPISRLDESLPHSHARDVPWALGGTAVPDGSGAGEEDEERSVANVDTAVVRAEQAGLRHPFTVALPGEDQGVFSVIGYAFDDPTAERTVHVDRYGGDVVSTYGYDDYPLLAKVVSQGIGLHEGRSFGAVNFVGSALLCLGVIFMCVTGPLMWWRRRPAGSGTTMAAPRGRLPVRHNVALLVALLALGVLLPLFGITLLLVLVLDQLVVRRIPALRSFFSAT
ncbi:PepSY-associated TM helix domain-containing protein [Nocardioides caldifontis]|uniref:PepSY-associated TM helix domain-containing protein n=1 Tax=Nocardioides caldifontis TaxID=2588938 RepID=UPI0011DF3812|nr:PepSY domain-containing protein [Nocardioides caldifontis]